MVAQNQKRKKINSYITMYNVCHMDMTKLDQKDVVKNVISFYMSLKLASFA